MSLNPGALKEKGYIPIAFSSHASIAWQGEHVDLWMWTGQYIDGPGGRRLPQTVRVREIKEAALREHKGLKAAGVRFPEGRFLPEPVELPEPLRRGSGAL